MLEMEKRWGGGTGARVWMGGRVWRKQKGKRGALRRPQEGDGDGWVRGLDLIMFSGAWGLGPGASGIINALL